MTEIERLISRHLDGELTPSEETRLRKLLAESPDASALMREMTVLGRAARRTPSLYAPGRNMEERLFNRLHAEGLHGQPAGAHAARTPGKITTPFFARLRQTALLATVLVAVIGGGYLLDTHGPVRTPLADGRVQATSSISPLASVDSGSAVTVPDVISNQPQPRHAHRAAGNARRVPRPVEQQQHPQNPADQQIYARVMPSQDVSDTAIVQPLADAPHHVEPPVLPPVPEMAPPHVKTGERTEQWMASLRGGISAIGFGQERVQELNMRVGVQTKGGHQIVLLVGNGPAIAETRHENTGIGIPTPSPSQIPINGRVMPNDEPALPEYQRTLKNETWFGVGYNYSISLAKGVSIDPGVKGGISASTWRMGIEIPVRYRVGGNISMECAFSATRVEPRNAGADTFTEFNAADHFIYEGSKYQPGFNALGVQVGIRVDLTDGN